MSEKDISITEEISEGYLPNDNQIISITDPTKDRYHSFQLISWWKQDIVKNATIMVVGAGALGNEVLKNLALMGVGRIFIVDFDTIEDANLSRSILFRSSDNGRQKAEIAAKAVREINPDIKVMHFHGDINHEIGLGIFRRMDVVIGCLDNREARLSINKACWHLNKPWIDGAIQELLGVARVFWPNRGACYECTLTDEDYRIISVRTSCPGLAHQNIIEGRVPTTPTISSIIASIETQEALKILHNMEVQTGKALVFNGLNNDIYFMEYPEKQDCLSHYIYKDIIELKEGKSSTTTLRELLSIAKSHLGDSAVLVIPQFLEKAICRICGIEKSFNIPLHKILFEEGLCKNCGQLMDVTTHVLEHVRGGEAFLDHPLNKFGIPPLGIIEARNESYQSVYFEMTGDEPETINFT